MKHDIDAINAALRLGDKFVPPIGAVIRTVGADVCYRVCCAHRIYGDMYEVQLNSDGSTFYLYIGTRGTVIYEYVEIPEDAPPFGEWERV
jgi:hypothetical protein